MKLSNPAIAPVAGVGAIWLPVSRIRDGDVQLTPVNVERNTKPGLGIPELMADVKFRFDTSGAGNTQLPTINALTENDASSTILNGRPKSNS